MVLFLKHYRPLIVLTHSKPPIILVYTAGRMPDVAPAAPAVPPAAAGGEEQPAEQQNTWKSIIWRLVSVLLEI